MNDATIFYSLKNIYSYERDRKKILVKNPISKIVNFAFDKSYISQEALSSFLKLGYFDTFLSLFSVVMFRCPQEVTRRQLTQTQRVIGGRRAVTSSHFIDSTNTFIHRINV